MEKTIFVTAIDTGTGKSCVVGLLARYIAGLGFSVITQKLAQTGCSGISEDIRHHRALMQRDLLPEDLAGLTCPYVFDFPASPHLAARLRGVTIDCARIERAAEALAAKFDVVILEGVGGLCVPLTDQVTVLDYIAAREYPVVLVSSAKLGSINHTLLSLEVLREHKVDLLGIAYNRYFDTSPEIAVDSRRVFERALRASGYRPAIIDIPAFDVHTPPDIDFSALDR